MGPKKKVDAHKRPPRPAPDTHTSKEIPSPLEMLEDAQYSLDSIDYTILRLVLQYPAITGDELSREVGLSASSVYRRQGKPAFKRALEEVQRPAIERVKNLRSHAVDVLEALLDDAESETVRIKAVELILGKEVLEGGAHEEYSQLAEIIATMLRASALGPQPSGNT